MAFVSRVIRGPQLTRLGHHNELDDLEFTSVAKVIVMSTSKEYIASRSWIPPRRARTFLTIPIRVP